MLSPHIKFNHSPRVSTGTHPGTVKAGDFVNLGASFRIVHYGGKGRVQMRLDSVAVIDRRSGDVCHILVVIGSSLKRSTEHEELCSS